MKYLFVILLAILAACSQAPVSPPPEAPPIEQPAPPNETPVPDPTPPSEEPPVEEPPTSPEPPAEEPVAPEPPEDTPPPQPEPPSGPGEPEPPTPPPAEPTPPSEPAPTPPPSNPAPTPPAEPAPTGKVHIKTSPGELAWEFGDKKGKGNQTFEIKPGTYKTRVHPGPFMPYSGYSGYETVEKNKTTLVEHDLIPLDVHFVQSPAEQSGYCMDQPCYFMRNNTWKVAVEDTGGYYDIGTEFTYHLFTMEGSIELTRTGSSFKDGVRTFTHKVTTDLEPGLYYVDVIASHPDFHFDTGQSLAIEIY